MIIISMIVNNKTIVLYDINDYFEMLVCCQSQSLRASEDFKNAMQNEY